MTDDFCGFYHFFYFSASFYPIWMKKISKFREILGLHDYHLGSVLDRSEPVPKPRSFLVFHLTNQKDRDRGPGRTGPGPVQFPVLKWSVGPDLKALVLTGPNRSCCHTKSCRTILHQIFYCFNCVSINFEPINMYLGVF